ncbi:DEAD/DEAH box helicase [Mammaliicoccus lentus]|uniref:DEAD/DEAH box helicase n=1 Tax=Mammaliicoccus lentus TaxID=42858 RepID=UPI0026470A24|nr:DEAD/DEAH box helicase [Mammaliicoccus lentus]
MDNLVNNTLSAWLLIESLEPGEVKYTDHSVLNKSVFLNNENQEKLQSFPSYYDIWNADKFKLSERAKSNGKLSFRLYRNCFMYKEIDEEIRDIFKDDREIFNLNKTKCYGYSFKTDDTGKVISDSLHIPMIMSALKEIKKNKSADIEEIFNDSKDKFEKKFSEIIANEPIDENKLNRLDEVYSEYFAVLTSKNSGMYERYFAIEYFRKNELPTPEFNSFYISDIERARKDPNATLKAFIEGLDYSKRTDVNDNKEMIDKFLNPENLPDGRWPSQIEHQLSLMQQVAVNSITSSNEYISSVNGPPGTGKTTLLKDIFAHLVVERAKALSKLANPKDAFEARRLHDTDSKPINILKEEFAQYKMAVASSNNGAVENISKDLPKLGEIVRKDMETEHPDKEAVYSKEIEALNSFSNVASDLIGEPAWGVFSGALGKKKNIDHVMKYVVDGDPKNNKHPLVKVLQDENDKIKNSIISKWKECKKEFEDELKIVQELKKSAIEAFNKYKENEEILIEEKALKEELNTLSEQQKKYKKSLDSLTSALHPVNKDIQSIKERISNIEEIYEAKNQKGFLEKIIAKFNNDEVDDENKEEKIALLEKKKEHLTKRSKIEEEIRKMEMKINENEKKIENKEKNLNLYTEKLIKFREYEKNSKVKFPENDFWNEKNYNKRQTMNLWNSDDLQHHRGLLFIKSMKLHKLLLSANNGTIYYALLDFKKRNAIMVSEPERVKNAWNIMHLIFPLISTTFASFHNLYRGLPKDFIDYLFIDEAGQAKPQEAVGALYRSKRAVIVGDPIQLEPVVTLEPNLIENIRKGYNIHEHLLSVESSVQSIADLANKYGHWKPQNDGDEDNKTWIGIPLWVHRRCLNPMFTIASEIAYNNKMVQSSTKKGKVGWLDIKGTATSRQYVKEHGERVVELLINDWKEAVENGKNEPSVFVISPFTEVQARIKSLTRSKLYRIYKNDKEKIKDWVDNSIGTVHTFQGKEADKVYFVVGTDDTQNGAVSWSCEKPNLLNVAVTRAKKEFYIIGDQDRIKSRPYYSTINENLNVKL